MTPDPGPWHARIAELEAEVARLREEALDKNRERYHKRQAHKRGEAA